MSLPFASENSNHHPIRKRRKLSNLELSPSLDTQSAMDISEQFFAPIELAESEPATTFPISHTATTKIYEFSSTSPPFLLLPVEIRLRIYYYAFQHPHGDLDPAWLSPFGRPIIDVMTPNERWNKESRPRDMGLVYWGTELMTRLLRVNRKIYREAIEVLYSEFVFNFATPGCVLALTVFLNTITQDSAALIRTIYVNVHLGFPGPEHEPHVWLCSGNNTECKHIWMGIVNRIPKLQCVYLVFGVWKGFSEKKSDQALVEDVMMDVLTVFSGVEQVHLRRSLARYGLVERANEACQRRHAELRAGMSSLFKEVFDMDKFTRDNS